MARPITTLFMLMSVDGKISPGATDDLDFDKNLPLIPGVKEGLQQYYDIEQTTDLWSLNSGRVQAKVGVNDDGSWNYASMRNSSSWLSMSYGKKWQGVLFLGYVKNLGLAEAASGPLAKSDVYFCTNGFANINQMYRINPQLIYNIGKLNVGLEYQWTSVQYGDITKLNAFPLADQNLHWVGNHRVNMMVKYNF